MEGYWQNIPTSCHKLLRSNPADMKKVSMSTRAIWLCSLLRMISSMAVSAYLHGYGASLVAILMFPFCFFDPLYSLANFPSRISLLPFSAPVPETPLGKYIRSLLEASLWPTKGVRLNYDLIQDVLISGIRYNKRSIIQLHSDSQGLLEHQQHLPSSYGTKPCSICSLLASQLVD